MNDGVLWRGLRRAGLARGRRVLVRVQSRAHSALDRRRAVPPDHRPVRVGGVPHVAAVVSRFDAVDVARDSLGRVRRALDGAGARHVVLPRPVAGRTVVAVDGDHQDALRDALRVLAADPEWAVALGSGWRGWQRPLSAWLGHVRALPPSFTVFRSLALGNGRVVGTAGEGVTVEVWPVVHEADHPRADGDAHVPGTRVAPGANSSFAYLTPRSWDAAADRGPGVPAPLALPHLFDVTFPVDVVYTWVDGSDPAWLRRKEEALRQVDVGALNATALSASRFATRDELRYSLRSLEMYASWVRRVHVVTDGQVPEWLDLSHPKLHLVHHRDIFSDASALPTFNSHAIESQLHHIDGLADHYLYLNDDVFFGRPVRPGLFFEANGLSRFFLSTMLLDVDPPSARDLPVLSAAKNNRELVEDVFGRTVTNKFKHTPHPQRRDVVDEMEDRFPDIFKSVARSVVRHPHDVSVAAALHHYYAYATARAVPGEIRYFYQDLAALRGEGELDRIDEGEGHDVFCLNDTHLQDDPGGANAVRLLCEYLSRRFPAPSSFERAG